MPFKRTYLVLGGAGLVGMQVCRKIASELRPERVVVASLLERESREALEPLQAEFPNVAFTPAWGNIFVTKEQALLSREQLISNPAERARLLQFLYGDFNEAFRASHLAGLILEHKPDVIVDAINTATGISYQDVFDAVAKVRDRAALGQLGSDEGKLDLDTLLLSQTMPQLTRHVRFYERACAEAGVSVYVKIGTTGTGGMGLNIPYTHSEDKPSQKLLAKNALGFGQTGLLFLWARTPGAPMVKEIKPAAMIGYKAVRHGPIKAGGKPMSLYAPHTLDLRTGKQLVMREEPSQYEREGDLVTVTVDTGENGIFTHGEFAAITSMGQMEFVTPEEIAHLVMLELNGNNTGRDMIAAIDGSVLQPTYRAGLLRNLAMRDLQTLEAKLELPSVALGRLGPPQLSKLLFEAALIRAETGGSIESLFAKVEDQGHELHPERLCPKLDELAKTSKIGRHAISVGVPILLSDGQTLLRGPTINVPELGGLSKTVSLEDRNKVDEWADRGWVDLRPANIARWIERFRRMTRSRMKVQHEGSAAVDLHSYMANTIEIGDAVAWIFNNEMGGYRIK